MIDGPSMCRMPQIDQIFAYHLQLVELSAIIFLHGGGHAWGVD